MSTFSRGSSSSRAFSRVVRVRVRQLRDDRRIGDAAERLHHLLDIAPDLRIERGPARVEHADHGPRAASERQLLSQLHTGELARNRGADDDLRRAGAEHPTLRDLHLRPQRLAHLGQSAHDHVAALGRFVDLRQRIQDHDLLGHQRLAVRSARHLGRRLDQRGLIAEHSALHFGLASLPDHDNVVGRTGRHQRGLETGVEHQHRGKHEYDQRHAAGRQSRRQLAHAEIARHVVEWNLHACVTGPGASRRYATCRRPSTIFTCAARIAGTMPATIPTASAHAACR